MSKTFRMAALALALAIPQAGYTRVDCGACMVKESALQRLQAAEKEYLELLEKNQRTLASVGSDDTSKGIKIKSNISMIHIHLQAVRDNILAANLDISRSCKECHAEKGSES
jgi:hypothetical protein